MGDVISRLKVLYLFMISLIPRALNSSIVTCCQVPTIQHFSLTLDWISRLKQHRETCRMTSQCQWRFQPQVLSLQRALAPRPFCPRRQNFASRELQAFLLIYLTSFTGVNENIWWKKTKHKRWQPRKTQSVSCFGFTWNSGCGSAGK